MKKLVFLLLLSGCSVNLRDDRIDPEKVAKILNQHALVIDAISTKIGELQDKGYLDKLEEKK